MNSFEIIRTVRLTEKGTRQGEKYNQYTVMADPRANKMQIRAAVQELFKVKVTRVNTLNVRGKLRRQRTKQAGRSLNWKKAIVTLKEGDKIVLTLAIRGRAANGAASVRRVAAETAAHHRRQTRAEALSVPGCRPPRGRPGRWFC